MTQPVPLVRSKHCEVHLYHAPAALGLEVHHIWPLGMGGPDTLGNRVAVCPTGHTNIHHLIRLLIKGQPLIGGRRERQLARSGYTQWLNAGKPGRPV